MSIRELIVLLEQGLAYAVLALGVLITFRVLNSPDLTVEGSFTLGAVTGSLLTLAGHPALGLLAGLGAGALAGLCTAALTTKCGVQPILSGILVMTGLYSVNLWIMGGRSNLPLMRTGTVFTPLAGLIGGGWHKVALLGGLAVLLCVGLNLFFRTGLGLSIRATGDNERMVRASSISTDRTKAIALAMSNGLVGLSGAVVAQTQQFADVGMGVGTVVIALASLIIGEALTAPLSQRLGAIARGTLAAALGSVAYRLVVTMALKVELPAYCVKLLTAALVAAAVSYPALRRRLALALRRRAAQRAGAGREAA
jgi:putative ABC transport system permease protein